MRAALEVEASQAELRLIVRREGEAMIVGETEALVRWAGALAKAADGLAAREPLASPETALEQLGQVPLPEGARALPASRVLRVAVAGSATAAVSSRQEVYPRGMSAGRALRLTHSLFASRIDLTVAQLRERVSSRYPEAESLPDRPELDTLLADADIRVVWDAQAAEGAGAYGSCRFRAWPRASTR